MLTGSGLRDMLPASSDAEGSQPGLLRLAIRLAPPLIASRMLP
jgi:hypothetical protein